MLEKNCASSASNISIPLQTLIPNLSTLISPVLQVAYDIQQVYDDLNFTKLNTGDVGLWQ